MNDMIADTTTALWCEKNKIKEQDIAIKNFIKIFFLKVELILLTNRVVLIVWIGNIEGTETIFLGKRSVNAFIAYSTAGLQLALILVLFVYGGYRLDVRFGLSPVFVLLGAILGMVVGLYNLLKGLKEVDRAMQEEKNEDVNRKRNKWM